MVEKVELQGILIKQLDNFLFVAIIIDKMKKYENMNQQMDEQGNINTKNYKMEFTLVIKYIANILRGAN